MAIRKFVLVEAVVFLLGGFCKRELPATILSDDRRIHSFSPILHGFVCWGLFRLACRVRSWSYETRPSPDSFVGGALKVAA